MPVWDYVLNATLKIAAGFSQQNPTKLRKKYTFPCFCCWQLRTLGILDFSKRSGFWCKPGQYKWKHFPKNVTFSFKNQQNFDKECNSSSARPLFSTISISYEFMEGMGEGKGALGEGLLLWLSPCTVPMQVVWCGCAHMAQTPMPPCPGHLIAPTMTWRWRTCYTASPGTCSGDETLLSSGESGGGGAATPCKCPGSCQQLIQDFTLVSSGELQRQDNHDRTTVCAVPSVSNRHRPENRGTLKFCFFFLFFPRSHL